MKTQKGNITIIATIVVIVAITAGAIGWMSARKIQEPAQYAANQQEALSEQEHRNVISDQPTKETNDFKTIPFVKIGEDEEYYYYEGYVAATGTYMRSVDSIYFILDSDQENLFPNLKDVWSGVGDKVLYLESGALALLSKKTKISPPFNEGDICNVSGKATVIISGYKADKDPGIGDLDYATIAKALSETEDKYSYWKIGKSERELNSCSATNPGRN